MDSLLQAIEETKVGDEVPLVIIREKNKRMEFTVTMKERK